MSSQKYLHSCNLLACILVCLTQPIESLTSYWGSRRSAPSIRMRNTYHAFTKSRRHILLAASASSSDPHPPDNPPDGVFFASSADIQSKIVDDEEDTIINNQRDKSVLERYVENKVESVKAKEMEQTNSVDEEYTIIVNDIDSVKNETKEKIQSSEQKIIADEQAKKEREEAQAKLAEESRIADEQAKQERKEMEAKLVERTRIAEEHAKKEWEEAQTKLAEETRIAEEQAKKEWEETQAKLAEEIRIADERRKAEISEWTNEAMESIETAIKPLTELQKGVPAERIKGAAIAGVALGLIASKGVIVSSAVGLSAAYVAISKSLAGDVLRTVGGITWDVTETATKLADKFSTRDNSIGLSKDLVEKTILKYQREKTMNDELNADEAAGIAYMESEDDLVRILKEAEVVIGEADAAIAKAEAEQISKEEKQTSEISLEDYERLALTEETEKNVKEDFEIMNEEDTNMVEEDNRITEDIKSVSGVVKETTTIFEDETTEQETEQEQEDEENATIEAQMTDEDIIFDDDEFMAAVEIAQEGIDGKIVGVDEIVTDDSFKAEWDAAGVLANELRQDEEEDEDEDDFFELDELDLDTLAQAARDAVNSYENNAKEVEDAAREQKQRWADSVIHDDNNFEDTFSNSIHLDDIALDTIDAVQEVNDTNAVNEEAYDSEDLADVPVLNDWSSFIVVELKKELKKRGLKTSGRKADLISLLKESDAELLGDKINGNVDSTVVDGEENDSTLWGVSDATIPEFDGEEDIDDVLEDFDIEELGRQARAAVEIFQQSKNVDFDEEPTEEMLTQLENELATNGGFLDDDNEKAVDISKMTVKELKVECKNRGLKVSGRKAGLIERLMNT